jgi:hypothetical protein
MPRLPRVVRDARVSPTDTATGAAADRTLAARVHRPCYERVVAVGPAREARHIGCDRFGVFSRRPARFLVLYQKNTLPKFWR